MTGWKNNTLVVYHGSDTYALKEYNLRLNTLLQGFDVDLTKCNPLTDFGRGFYVTTSVFQARNWANDRVRKRQSTDNSKAALLSFELDRNWLSSLESLCFVLPSSDFWEIIKYSREGNIPHNRQTQSVSCKGYYDMVYAPVSLWPQYMTIGNADQISFHSEDACNSLPAPRLIELGSDQVPFLGKTRP